MIQAFNARQVLRKRLLWVGFVAATLVGVVTWLTEYEKVDERVLALAVSAA